MQKKLVAVAAFVFFLMPGLFAASTDIAARTATICRDNPVVEKTKQMSGFTVAIGHAGDFQCHFVEVKKQGRVLYRDQEIGSYFYFGPNPDHERSPFKRLTRGGHLNLVLSEWSGGAHCCFSLKIFDLDDGVRSIADVEGGSFVPIFKNLDSDSAPEIEAEDDFLAYRFASFASSAIGHVILKYQNGRYEVAANLMRKPITNLKFLNKEVRSWQSTLRKSAAPEFPRSFMQAITDLAFTGNKKTALDLVDSCWPPERSGKDTFIKTYLDALSDSRFFTEFERGL